MKITDVFEGKHVDYIENLISNKNYEHIRLLADHLLELDERQFAYDFDYVLSRTFIFPVEGTDPEGNKFEVANEIIFVYYLQYRLSRAMFILDEYVEHADHIKKPISEELTETVDQYMWKEQFLFLKMKKIISKEALRNIETTLQKLEKSKKEPQQNTLNGKKLNLLERYEIAKKVFDIDNQIRTLKISEGEKDKLLSLILDCNITNARHIMNGRYSGKIREELISEYIQTLKE